VADKLTYWNVTAPRQAILDFLAAVTDPQSPRFVAPEDRIATFDNDGTLWCEKPLYVQLAGVLADLAERAASDPALMEQPLFRAAHDMDMAWFGGYLANDAIAELLQMLVQASAGDPQAVFEARARAWLESARHPRFDRRYIDLTYKPMLELMDILRAHDFRVFICTGGGMDYVRLVSEQIYSVPRHHVIGSNMKLSWQDTEQGPALVRQPAIQEPFNDGPGKPVNIQLQVGRPPIFTAGNSDGDLEMMEYAAASGLPCLNLLVRHDDEQREYAYDRSAERVQAAAAARGWTVVSMRADWRTVF
jgi:phosphoserine phosphatase